MVKIVFLQVLDVASHSRILGMNLTGLEAGEYLVTQIGHQAKLADLGLATTERYATEFGCGSTFYMLQDKNSHSFTPLAITNLISLV
jgi:hypothetical protein